ncbi:MAG: LPP20 family lipoprotein [Bacteroidales bacterium]|nr:LPP20 family lipoprotein [Bacteroidales bacterium]HOY38208.1 LPP20 family lipoprotein [Bacteroidales bacterium]HQP03011.1 LPP20 family lipoprotein [Bacteroidales bacterium]
MKQTVILFLLAGLLMSGCKTLQNTTEAVKPQPEWVKSKPVSSFYYIGIGSATKPGFAPADYTQTAQQKALGDLAREISVTISSASVLSVMEHNYNITENWTSEVTTSTETYLEGYELVDSWEDKNYYWVYYRLSKEKYAQMQAERKNKAIADAVYKYYEGQTQRKANCYTEALRFYADALTALKPYMNESTETIVDSVKADIGQTVLNAMVSMIQSIVIEHPYTEIKVIRGTSLSQTERSFIVYNQNRQVIADLPVEIKYTGVELKNERAVSDNSGKVMCDFNKIVSSGETETISLSVDLITMSRVSKDPFIRKIIKQLPVKRTSVVLIIEKPAFFVISTEKEFGTETGKALLSDALRPEISRANKIADTQSQADFVVQIDANTVVREKVGYETITDINVMVTVFDKKNEQKFQKQYVAEGEGQNSKESSNDAYQEAVRLITRKAINDINSALFSNLP